MTTLRIDNDELVSYTRKLEAYRKKGLLYAIMYTLNDTVRDLKTTEVLKSTKENFNQRSGRKTFFKARSTFVPTKVNKIDSMRSSVHFFSKPGDVKDDDAISNLKTQEKGGKIARTLLYGLNARVAKSKHRNIKTKRTLKEIGVPYFVKNEKNFLKFVFTKGVGEYIVYKGILFRIDKIKPYEKSKGNSRKHNSRRTKLIPLYSYVLNRKVSIKGTGFMKEAAEESHKKMEGFYKTRVHQQLNKQFGKRRS